MAKSSVGESSRQDGGGPSRLLEIDGRFIPLQVRVNRRARRIILRVEPTTGDVILVAPSKEDAKFALQFAAKNKDWVAKRLAEIPPDIPFEPGTRVPYLGTEHLVVHDESARRGVWRDESSATINVSGDADFVARRTRDWLKKEARRVFTEHVERLAAQVDRRPGRITIRDPLRRWGSCAANGNLSFSWRLIMAPDWVVHYVAAHEVAHLVHHDHSRAFWRLVDTLDPRAKEASAWLNAEGFRLHRYGR